MIQRFDLEVGIAAGFRFRVHYPGPQIDALRVQIEAAGSVIEAAIALIAGLKADLDSALGSRNLAALTALSANWDAHAPTLAAAVASKLSPEISA